MCFIHPLLLHLISLKSLFSIIKVQGYVSLATQNMQCALLGNVIDNDILGLTRFHILMCLKRFIILDPFFVENCLASKILCRIIYSSLIHHAHAMCLIAFKPYYLNIILGIITIILIAYATS